MNKLKSDDARNQWLWKKKLNFVRTYSEQASDKSNDQKSSFGAVRFIHFSFSIWTVELDQGSNKGNRWPD